MTLGALWRWSWVVTAPVAVVFAVWAAATWERFEDFGVRLEAGNGFDLHAIGTMEFDHLLAAPRRPWQGAPPPPPTGLRRFELHLAAGGQAALERRLPTSARDFVAGTLDTGDGPQRVELRYRGDNVYHWGYYKKSWRVRTRRSHMVDDMRSFNLIAPRTPELLNNHFGYLLAGELGLIAPRSEPVDLCVDGRYQGVHILTEQLEESTLRRHRRMPGDLFSGDVIGRDQPYGLVVDLFRHPGLWTKAAINNHFAADSLAPLEDLLTALADVDLRFDDGLLAERFDLDAAGRFAAMELLAATNHYDRAHNWRLLWDSWRRRFEPVVWDPIGWMAPPDAPVRLDVLTSPMHVAWFRDHDFLRARFAALRGFLQDHRDRFLAAVDRDIARVRAALPSDPNLTADVAVLTAAAADAAIVGLRAEIVRTFDELERVYLHGPVRLQHAPAGPGRLRLSVEGRAPTARLRLRPASPPAAPPLVHLCWTDERGPQRVDVSSRCALDAGALVLDVSLLAQHIPVVTTLNSAWVGDRNHVLLAPATYDLEFDPPLDASLPPQVQVTWADGRSERAAAAASLPATVLDRARHVQRPAPIETTPVWSGVQTVDGTTIVDGDLVIRPGTEVRLQPGAVLEVHGRLTAAGTATAPIRFVSAGAEPWGALLLQGRGCDGSTLRHCEFTDGSGQSTRTYESTAMLSLHDCRAVTVAHCHFRDNHIVDDMVHVVYSEVVFEDCVLERSNMDALDSDISQITVRRCRFIGAGNDGIDLMETHALVDGCEFEGCRDKGMSVGEGSLLLAVDCLASRCTKGIEVKDRSIAFVLQTEFRSCGLAANAYAKNWRYGGGGTLEIARSLLLDSGAPAAADKKSHVRLVDCRLRGADTDARQRTGRLELEQCDDYDVARAPMRASPPPVLTPLGPTAAARWTDCQHGRRGRVVR